MASGRHSPSPGILAQIPPGEKGAPPVLSLLDSQQSGYASNMEYSPYNVLPYWRREHVLYRFQLD